MDAEHAHAVERARVAARSGRQLHAVVDQAVDIEYKIRERLAAARLKAARKVAQQVQVFHRRVAAADSAGHSAQRGQLQHPADQLVHGADAGAGAQRGKLTAEGSRARAYMLRRLHCGKERGIAVFGAYLRQLVGREAVNGAAQHREQRNVLCGVVDHAQEVEHELDLGRVEGAFLFLAVGGNTVVPERLHKKPDAMIVRIRRAIYCASSVRLSSPSKSALSIRQSSVSQPSCGIYDAPALRYSSRV